MTRINVVPVEMLSDDHLKGEYKEITRPFTNAKKKLEAGKCLNDFDIPKEYKLNSGHEIFWYDKLRYIQKRHYQLFSEMRNRGYQPDQDKMVIIQLDMEKFLEEWVECNYDYTPTHNAIYLNFARMCKMSKMDNVLEELQLNQ